MILKYHGGLHAPKWLQIKSFFIVDAVFAELMSTGITVNNAYGANVFHDVVGVHDSLHRKQIGIWIIDNI